MATHRNALALYDAQVAKFAAFPGKASQVWELLPEGAETDAKELLSGTIPTSRFIKEGHPLARFSGPVLKYDPRHPARDQVKRGRGRGSIPLLPVNKQKGNLFDALERQKTTVPGALHAQRVGFDRAKAGDSLYVLSPEGTTRMVARGFWRELTKRWRLRNRAFRDVFVRAQRRALS